MVLEKNLRSIVHFMTYTGPGLSNSVSRGEAPEEYLISTIKSILEDPYFGCIEITGIKRPSTRAKVAELLKKTGKRVIFSCQPIQLINEDGIISPFDISSIDESDRVLAVDRIKGCIDEGLFLGASAIGLVSGRDPGTESGLKARYHATAALIRSLDEICTYASIRSQAEGVSDFQVTLELFDRIPEKGCKNQLVGPSDEAAELARVLRSQYAHKNFGLLYDLSHMPMIRGISFAGEDPSVLNLLAPYLNHIHIGNCVLDRDDPAFGDSHPKFGYQGGAIKEDDLASFIKRLHEIGYEGPIGFEITPRDQEIGASVINIAKAWLDDVVNRIDVNYALGRFSFFTRKFFPEYIFDMITEARVERPWIIKEEAETRQLRQSLTNDGKLTILAADHPGRNVTRDGDNPVAMGNRLEYLGRVLRVMISPEIDGLMATPDIIDDLFILSRLLRERGRAGFLDGKVLVGCMNRGGLAGADYEMDDRMTAYTAKSMKEMRLDAAKILFRYEKESRFSLQTMKYCSDAINDCNQYGLPMFLEPLPVERTGSYKVKMTMEDMIRMVGVASAMGNSSSALWIKIPYVKGYHMVAKATTLPILMLGGESQGDPTGTILNFEKGMASGNNVRGALVGRNVLFPGTDDPMAVAVAINRIVHAGVSTSEAVKYLASVRGSDMDWFTSILG